ncbi:MAG: BON domain-containing protein [Gammaproteobacteria bacterium]
MNGKVMTLVLALSASTAGCVFVVNPEEGYGDEAWQSEWESDESSWQRAYSPQSAVPGLAERVARSYGTDDMLRDADIRVTAREGVVTLHGRVPSRAHFDRAVELALGTEGVSVVESRLTVEVHKS